jgi:hypothetical protein
LSEAKRLLALPADQHLTELVPCFAASHLTTVASAWPVLASLGRIRLEPVQPIGSWTTHQQAMSHGWNAMRAQSHPGARGGDLRRHCGDLWIRNHKESGESSVLSGGGSLLPRSPAILQGLTCRYATRLKATRPNSTGVAGQHSRHRAVFPVWPPGDQPA